MPKVAAVVAVHLVSAVMAREIVKLSGPKELVLVPFRLPQVMSPSTPTTSLPS